MTTRQHSRNTVPAPSKSPTQARSRKTPTEVPESIVAASVAPPIDASLLDQVDADLRHRMISEAAFHLYEKRGFADGYDSDDWLQAEAAVERQLLEQPLTKGPTPKA
jgi:hypothetical protein